MRASEGAAKLTENVRSHYIGREETVLNLCLCLFSGGHVLLEDVPGVGKTTLARALAGSIDAPFARIQCTPDTLPSDIVGASIYDPSKGSFRVTPGPALAGIVLADELNRTSPKTQSALLEVMEERRATIDGRVFPVQEPYLVIGTQNAKGHGIYPLPEAQLDRFMMKLSLGIPEKEKARMLAQRSLAGELAKPVEAVLTGEDVRQIREEVRAVRVHDDLIDYAEALAEETRKSENVAMGVSPRGFLQLLRASQAIAAVSGRDFCIPEDIRTCALPVFGHRIFLTQDARMRRVTEEDIIEKALRKVEAPK